jgi:hypothetical protein
MVWQSLKKSTKDRGDDLSTQIDVFEEEGRCDLEEMEQRFADLGIDNIECVITF